MHLRALLRATGWFAGTALLTLTFYPIIYGDSWTATISTTFAARVLVPAMFVGGLSLTYDTLFHNDTPQPR